MDVQKDDVIFHCAGGYIQAISRAMGAYEETERPCRNKIIGEVDWSDCDGRKINCDYTVLKYPIKHGDYKDVLASYSNIKHSPFNKKGTCNQGYLFELDKNLAKFFLEKISKRNPEILELEYLRNFLEL